MASSTALIQVNTSSAIDRWQISILDAVDRAEAVLHQIHARLVRERAQFFADGFSRRHAPRFHAKAQRRKEIFPVWFAAYLNTRSIFCVLNQSLDVGVKSKSAAVKPSIKYNINKAPFTPVGPVVRLISAASITSQAAVKPA